MQDSFLDGKTVLVTGGTGSFGEAFLKRCLDTGVKEIRVFSRDEKKQDDMKHRYAGCKAIKFIIGDIRDEKSISKAMKGVDYVFHAAAMKQVPSCEDFPEEAVKTNVTGSINVLDAAIEHNVKRVVMLSTDKAVYPVNSMGMTKALMEKVSLSKSQEADETIICCTRFGNVMGSRSSVIPLFYDQLMNDQPLTVTSPHMERYMMTLEEAIDLVMYAMEHGEKGDLFVYESPVVTIGTLAHAMMKKIGKRVPIEIIGVRPGEKMSETLFTYEEEANAIRNGCFVRIPYERDLNKTLEIKEGAEYLSVDAMVELLDKLDLFAKE